MHFAKSKLFNRATFKHSIRDAETLPIAPFKAAIKKALAVLEEQQVQGASSADLVGHFTWMIDQLLILIWNHQKQSLDDRVHLELVAVGGYGRGELHPRSDVDLLVLLKKDQYDEAKEFVESFLRFLWDIGLDIGHSVRSIRDCVKEARSDVTVMTNLLEARHLAGDKALFELLDTKIRAPRMWAPDKFFIAKTQEQEQRHAQYQDTAYSLEPNLKESPGGLRDLQTILWIYNRRYGVRSFRDMAEQKLIDRDEYRILIRARNILWRMRSGLHLITQRHEDRLLFDTQRTLADDFGYLDTSTHLAVEQLMKRYYRTAKQVMYLNEVLLASYRVTHSKRISLAVGRNLNDNFLLKNKMIEQRSSKVFKRQPSAMLELFNLMQEHKITVIHPDTIRSIRANLDLINNQFRSDPDAHKRFLALFKHEGDGLTNALARMNAYGLLGAYLPSFGAIVGQMQHDLFHVYTVDGHTLKVIENLTRLRKYPDEFPMASELLADLYKPERLFLGALFHDIAKGRGGDHSELGESDAYEFCIQHGLSEYDARLVGWLVLKHLMMSHFSQRRDISDPDVIKEFADIVGDIEHLDNLYLLTLADIRGTSPKVWNAWKGQLLLELYNATRKALRQGVAKPHNVREHVEDDKRAALELITQQLGEKSVNEELIQTFWNTLPGDYFVRNEPYYIAWHASSLLLSSAIDIPLVTTRYSERLEANMFFVFAPETNKLLTQVTGAFDRMELNIIEARLQLSSNGFALYTFNATVPESDTARSSDYARFIEARLRKLIIEHSGEKFVARSHSSRALKHFPIEPRITFLFTSKSYTTMEVVAQDQPGLLHNVARVLQTHNLILLSARVATFGERAEDIFYIRHGDHSPVVDKNLLQQLESELSEALDKRTSAQKQA
ncbi:[protein-PII] uridylyltransferase [Arenicella xantha]|uniref:Bifunctional uridylyltransferase/uridylyl-removing enzyme n=1 Tax=Arenicella xantha TaxID=644221 RepID=A0A395JMX8_9GAMM|nr:[protein-PII] uridylyltransferase [Arenicella xantha]RBP50954.1 UTP--GlnB (protein PII) uridylyltransferase GlnD [Arenicella xantha]